LHVTPLAGEWGDDVGGVGVVVVVDADDGVPLIRSYVCLDDVFLCDLLLWVISGHCV